MGKIKVQEKENSTFLSDFRIFIPLGMIANLKLNVKCILVSIYIKTFVDLSVVEFFTPSKEGTVFEF